MMGFWAPGKVGMRLEASLLVNRGRFGIGWTELDGESSACDLDLREAVKWNWGGVPLPSLLQVTILLLSKTTNGEFLKTAQ